MSLMTSSPHLAHRRQGSVHPSPCLGLEAEDGHNDGHNGSDDHGNQDSFRLVHATKKVTSHLSILLPEGCWRSFPTAPVLGRNFAVPEPKGLEHPLGPGSLSVDLAALWRTGGTPDPVTAGSPGHTWQSCLSSAPWPASVGEKSELSGLPNCPHVLLSLPAHLGSWGAMGAPPRPLASPSPLTKMLSRIIFQGKRLLRTKWEREKLVTGTMSCPPGPHHLGAAPGRNLS